jgi:uncharacterized damage-inducible protein DinB
VNDLRYPIGPFRAPGRLKPDQRASLLGQLRLAPRRLRDAVRGLSESQIDTPYRPEGWTVRQVVHHVADSHVHGYLRCKHVLTEDQPTLETYEQDDWAALDDAREAPLEPSLSVLDGVHDRWAMVLERLPADAWSRGAHHPESGDVTLDDLLALYVWHGDHHVAHLTALRDREGWEPS